MIATKIAYVQSMHGSQQKQSEENNILSCLLLRKHSRNLILVENAPIRKFLHLLSMCDAVMTKRSRRLGHYQIRMEEIPSL